MNNKTYLGVTPSIIATNLGATALLSSAASDANQVFTYDTASAISTCGVDSFVYHINDPRVPQADANATVYVTILGTGECVTASGLRQVFSPEPWLDLVA